MSRRDSCTPRQFLVVADGIARLKGYKDHAEALTYRGKDGFVPGKKPLKREGTNWEATSEEHILQSKIGERASALAKAVGIEYKQITAMMDVGACHSNGNPLRLADLLESDDANFAHDVFGIRANIDRTTGKLMNCFVPRYSEIEQ